MRTETNGHGAERVEQIPTVCYMCFNACSVIATKADGVVVKLEGDPKSPHNEGKLCAKGNAGIMSLYDPSRLKRPMKRTNPEKGIGIDPQWQEISWDEALDTIAGRLKTIRARDPKRLLLTTFDVHSELVPGSFCAAFSTPNFHAGAAGYFCGAGLHPICWTYHGSFYNEPDLDRARYGILIGSQTGTPVHLNPMGLTPRMRAARERGMKLVVVDPIGTSIASKADEWLPIRPGTDAALALAWLNVLLNEESIYDAAFLQRYTNGPYLIGPDGLYVRDPASGEPLVWDARAGQAHPYNAEGLESLDLALLGRFTVNGAECEPAFQKLKDHVKAYAPERVETLTSIPAATIRRIGREFGEAASIGSTVSIQGETLPYRPVWVNWSKGPIGHKHAILTGLAINLLNVVVGCLDVPGGHLGVSPVGPWWEPTIGPDGLLVPARALTIMGVPYPVPKATKPRTVELKELFPIAYAARPIMPRVLDDPRAFGLDYEIDLMIQCRANYMLTTADTKFMERMLKKIPFIVSFCTHVDETAEFADIVLPDAHYLERYGMFPNWVQCWIVAGESPWYWMGRQPVVEPEPGVRHWCDVLLDLAERVGFVPDLNRMLNVYMGLKPPYQLDDDKHDFVDLEERRARSTLGPEYGWEYFKKHGFHVRPRSVREAYPRVFIKPRVPVYLEHFIRAGREVQNVTRELGWDWWDVSNYQPLPDWKPCSSYEVADPSYDLWAVNYKGMYHTFSVTAQNAWLAELSDHLPDDRGILINAATAKAKGLADGDPVFLETSDGGRAEGYVRVVETIHPAVVGLCGVKGHWAKGTPIASGKGTHYNDLLKYDFARIDFLSAALDMCTKVRISKRPVSA